VNPTACEVWFRIVRTRNVYYNFHYGYRKRWTPFTELRARNVGLQRWHRMQCIKMKSTLRVGPKSAKKAPHIVKRVGEQDEQIKYFIDFRDIVKSILKTVNLYHNC